MKVLEVVQQPLTPQREMGTVYTNSRKSLSRTLIFSARLRRVFLSAVNAR
jgi:hypothetical protein